MVIMAARITKAQKAAFAEYVENGGKATIRQYLALAAGREKMLANRAVKSEDSSAVAIVSKRTGRKAKAAKPVATLPISQLLRAPSGSRVDFMGGNLVVDEAGTVALIDALDEAGFAPQVVGKQTSKRRGVRTQVTVPASQVEAALAVADKAGFRTWSAA